ncbi:MAG: vitamin K epoxide reductase family protein [Phycisphaerae bacterium]
MDDADGGKLKRSRWNSLQVTAALLAVAAAVISFNLLVKHLGGSPGPAWFQAGCSDGSQEGGADCAAVLASRYASIPFRQSTDPPGTAYIPVAFLGLVYYSALAVWLVGIGQPSYAHRWVQVIPLGMVTAGLTASAVFTYIMLTAIDEWCPWCLVTHILNLMIAVAVVLMWPRARGKPQVGTVAASPAGASPGALSRTPLQHSDEAAYPSVRMTAVVLAAVAFLAFAQCQMLGNAQRFTENRKALRSLNACMAAVKRIQGDAGTLMVRWQKEQPVEITLRPDDPTRAPAATDRQALRVVVFSDFECHACRELAAFLHRDALPLFDGSLEVIYKHYPLDTQCNPRMKSVMHKHACHASRLAEAARLIGGNDAFWSIHDFFFENQDRLKSGVLAEEEIAQHVGMDLQQLRDAVASGQIDQRIAEDIALAARCGVTGTPALFINGKRLDSLGATAIGFWNLLADLYWEGVGVKRPSSTRLDAQPATQDTQDPSGAP